MSKQNLTSTDGKLPVIVCAFHPSQTITHYCRTKQCMLPLCKTCLIIHQKEHKTITNPPDLMPIQSLMEVILQQINLQQETAQSKYSLMRKSYRALQQLRQEAFRRINEERLKSLECVNRRFDQMLGEVSQQLQQRLSEIRIIHYKVETLQSTLEKVSHTFNKNKPMRTVILWESNNLGQDGIDLLNQTDLKLREQIQRMSLLRNTCDTSETTLNLRDGSQVNIDKFNRHLEKLGTIIEMEIDTKNSPEPKRSSVKLRTSGISLTQVSILKSQSKRSNNSMIMGTPERQINLKKSVLMSQPGREFKAYSGRLATMATLGKQ